MSTTVFCTFDQRDIADLAIGRLRSSIRGIHSIEYLSNDSGGENGTGSRYNFISGWGLFSSDPYPSAQFASLQPVAIPVRNNTSITPSNPASVKIVCEDGSKDAVMSKLVNLHAYNIYFH